MIYVAVILICTGRVCAFDPIDGRGHKTEAECVAWLAVNVPQHKNAKCLELRR